MFILLNQCEVNYLKMKPYSNRNANKRVAGYKRKRSLASADEVVR